MGRQYRPPRSGGSGNQPDSYIQNAGPTVGTASSVAAVIPNYGFTNIGSTANWPAGDYMLAAPVEGVVKTIVCVTSSSDARVIKLSSDASVSVGRIPATTGASGNTQITFNATIDQCVTLLGINSTHWAIINVYPQAVAVNSTGVVIAST